MTNFVERPPVAGTGPARDVADIGSHGRPHSVVIISLLERTPGLCIHEPMKDPITNHAVCSPSDSTISRNHIPEKGFHT